jgi:hypothetical protein
MEENNFPRNTRQSAFERTVKGLCNEIDSLEAEVEYWRGRYEKSNLDYNQLINDNIRSTGKLMTDVFVAVFQ